MIYNTLYGNVNYQENMVKYCRVTSGNMTR